MATVFYDKAAVEVTHNGVSEQLLATDCSLSFSSAQAPLYAIGSKGTLGQFPAGARQGDLSFSFLTTVTGTHFGVNGNIINSLASGIKEAAASNSEVSGVEIRFAGVTGSGYLNSYGVGIQGNSVSSSSCGFTFFGSGTQLPVTGRLDDFAGQTIQTGKLATGIAHGRYTNLDNFATSIAGDSSSANVFGADYSITFNHNPVYKVGQEFPMTCLYTNAQETLGITEDIFQSGLAFDPGANDLTLTVSGLGGTHGMQIGLSGAKQVSTAMSAGMDDIVRTQKNLTAAY
ncbi:MAG TPA: hypothetical protein EYN67_18870 [Flavobacteriales bacterium]|nr:hypothetical protein [Flavobacteriales bacterium]